MNTRHVYKGYTYTAISTPTDDGRYRSRAAIMALAGSRTRSQRFLDLEVFRTEAEANDRALRQAVAWIDEAEGNDPLALPTNFATFD